MRRPNFFIVGAPKCGTSSMWRYLDAHPDVFMSKWKEPHFFSRLDLPWKRTGWGVDNESEYIALFRDATGESRLGEASTWYLCSGEAHRQIHAFSPDAKIICMLRDPVAMICSMFHQNVSNGNEDVFDLGEALDMEGDRMQGRKLPPHAPYPADFYYTHSARYAEQLTRYFETFGRENVLVLLFDDFAKHTDQVYAKTLEFLDIADDYQPDFSVVNSKRPIRNRGIRRFLIARPRLSGALDRYIPASARSMVGKTLAAVTPQTGVAPVMSCDTLEGLRSKFKPEIEKLEALLECDLSAWRTAS